MVPLIPTFIASEVSLIVSSSRTPTVMGQMANSVALVAFGSTRTIMVIVAFRARWLRSPYGFFSPGPAVSALLVFCLLFSCCKPSIYHSILSDFAGNILAYINAVPKHVGYSLPHSSLNWALVIGVVVVVVMAGDDLVVLFGAIFFKS
uniref:Uncharacterized protein n=1 Tax=Tanacetum cinerariifolium TaxID=118510 RepID=A0A6L2LGG0_TANCI|nr:hypothetical protein [Tanacetum cinerariifolium]